MAKWFKYLFAQDGDKTAIPDATDPTGLVSYQQGYGADYQRVLGTDPLAKAIERNKLNQALNDITGALQQYQTHGFPDYIGATTNGGTAYAYEVGAVVRFTDKKNYQNTVASNTNAPDVSGWVLYNNGASAIVAATAKTTPVDADLFGLVDSAASNVLKKLTWANIKTTLGVLFAPLVSPAFTGSPTAPSFSYKPTPVTVTSWSYVATTITLNVASHTFVSGDYIEVGGLTATTNIPNGVHLVASVTATTIVFTYALTPTGTAGVSSATVKGYMTANGRVEGIGVGQTWQNVTASRALGTTYTNTTGKPIMVAITLVQTSQGTSKLVIDSIDNQYITTVSSGSLSLVAIIKAGSSYSAVNVTSGATLNRWMELR
jgi:hypothetical protein